MSVHKKLMQARVKLQGIQLKKSGHNKFAGYQYFELSDFLPSIQSIFNEIGICGVVSYTKDYAELSITDVEDGTMLTISSPMAEANLKGTHPIQNLGAVETYQRRYLWMTAMEIVEHDMLDATTGAETKPSPKAKPAEKPAEPVKPPPVMSGKGGDWNLKVTMDGSDSEEWVKIVMDATKIMIENTAQESDLFAIFRVNKNIYDKLKEISAAEYEVLLALFTEAKGKFA
jgi:hypothetical protein